MGIGGGGREGRLGGHHSEEDANKNRGSRTTNSHIYTSLLLSMTLTDLQHVLPSASGVLISGLSTITGTAQTSANAFGVSFGKTVRVYQAVFEVSWFSGRNKQR